MKSYVLVAMSDGGITDDHYTEVEGHSPRTDIGRQRATCWRFVRDRNTKDCVDVFVV